MRLTVEVPSRDAYMIRGRVTYALGEVTIGDTRVCRLRRVERNGQLVDTEIQALAFIPESYRSGIEHNDRRWCGQEMYWARVIVKKNRRSLADFLASGERELAIDVG